MIVHTLRLTNKCCNSCVFCYKDCFDIKEANITEIKDYIDKTSPDDAANFDLSGGEPTMSRDLPEIIMYIKKMRKNSIVSLQTNGILLADKEYAATLKGAGLDYVRVSIHSHIESVSDRLTKNRGGWKKTTKAIKNLSELGVAFGVCFVINSENYGLALDFAKYMEKEFPSTRDYSFSMICEPINYREGNDHLARLRDIDAHLNKAIGYLNKKKKTVIVFGIPYCYLRGNEGNYSLEQLQREHVKDEKCANCALGEACPGIIREYGEFFGTREARPFKKADGKLAKELAEKIKKHNAQSFQYFNSSPTDNLRREKEKAVFEKKKHIRLLTFCNNNCIFCLNADSRKVRRGFGDIKKELKEGIEEGCTKVVLSGGEPTIHPDILEIVAFAKKIGYTKIQTISNGRMYSYFGFLKKMVKNGLTEVTFSIHGHKKEVHDYLTGIPGSFEQVLKAVRNAVFLQGMGKLFVNADVVINKRNYKELPRMLEFLCRIGIMEVDLLQVIPFGNAWKNRKEIFYDFNELPGYLDKAIRFGERGGMVIWTNRIAPQLLEGHEELIHDPWKLNEEINKGSARMFEKSLAKNEKFYCYDLRRCALCSMEGFCANAFRLDSLLKGRNFKSVEINNLYDGFGKNLKLGRKLGCSRVILNSPPLKKDINSILSLIKKYGYEKALFLFDGENMDEGCIKELTKRKGSNIKIHAFIDIKRNNFQKVGKLASSLNEFGFDKLKIGFFRQPFKMADYRENAVKVSEVKPQLEEAIAQLGDKAEIVNIPRCLFGKGQRKRKESRPLFKPRYIHEERIALDLQNLCKEYIRNLKLKSLRCRSCSFDGQCEGIFEKYIRTFGFKELTPIK